MITCAKHPCYASPTFVVVYSRLVCITDSLKNALLTLTYKHTHASRRVYACRFNNYFQVNLGHLKENSVDPDSPGNGCVVLLHLFLDCIFLCQEYAMKQCIFLAQDKLFISFTTEPTKSSLSCSVSLDHHTTFHPMETVLTFNRSKIRTVIIYLS